MQSPLPSYQRKNLYDSKLTVTLQVYLYRSFVKLYYKTWIFPPYPTSIFKSLTMGHLQLTTIRFSTLIKPSLYTILSTPVPQVYKVIICEFIPNSVTVFYDSSLMNLSTLILVPLTQQDFQFPWPVKFYTYTNYHSRRYLLTLSNSWLLCNQNYFASSDN